VGFFTFVKVLFMTNWTSGYEADIGYTYTYGYYLELKPQRPSNSEG
jgi:hypothetical protein